MTLNENSGFIYICDLESVACRDHVFALQMGDQKSEAWRWLTPSHVGNTKFRIAPGAD